MFATLLATIWMAASVPQDVQSPASLAPAQGRVDQPVELGQVRWRRDFEKGLAEAKRSDKPALLLFQEVPG